MAPFNSELMENVMRWADRGRGIMTFPGPVSPVPPFVPFPGHVVPRQTVDSGDRPTFLSRLAAKVGQALKPVPTASDAGLRRIEVTEPEPMWLDDEERVIREYRILLPADVTLPYDAVSHFLLDISLARHPLAIEIIGDSEGATFQFATRDDDAHLLETQLMGHFPDLIFREMDSCLETAWQTEEPAERVVIEFALRRPFMLPLESIGKRDPFVGIVAAVAGLESGEAAVYQVIFSPVSAPWQDSALRAVTGDDGRPFFEGGAELLKATRQKISSPMYAAVVRLAATGPDLDRVWHHIRGMAAAFRLFASQGGNELMPCRNDDYDEDAHNFDLLQRQSRRVGMLLSLDELLGFVHFPTSAVASSAFMRDRQNTRAAASSTHEDGVCLGFNYHNGEERPVWVNTEKRVRHMHVIGASGSGKTTFLFNLLLQDIENGQGIAMLDPHGDLVDKVLGNIPASRIHDVVLVDPSDEDYIVPFNFLQAHSEFEKTLLASDLVAIFRANSTSWGDQMNSVFGNAIRTFLESSEGGTLADVRRFLLDPKWRDEFLQTVTDPDVLFYWKHGFPQLGGNRSIGPILTRLETFLSPKPLRYMVSQRENRLDFADIMDSGKIFLAKLPQGRMGKENSYLLGSLLIAKLQQMAMSRQRMASANRRPFFVYADEFHNFICPSMSEILSGARKYGVGLILAHQDLRQLERDKEVASAVLSNSFTRVVFRVGDSDARSLAEGLAHFDARNLQNLEIGEAICRIERADNDFNLSVPILDALDEVDADERQEEVIKASRAAYATPRDEVEAELNASREESERSKSKPRPKTKGDGETQPSEAPPLARPPETKSSPSERTPVDAPERAETDSSAGASEQGKGGNLHRIVQERLQRAGFDQGFRATLEFPVGEGKETIDVGLLRDDLRIACEVSVTTTIDHEMGNARKCLKAAFDFVLLITSDLVRRTQMKDAVQGHFSPAEQGRIHCLSPDESVEFVSSKPPLISVSTASIEKSQRKVVRGFMVKRKFVLLTPAERAAKSKAAFEILAEEMKKPAA